MNHGGFVDEQHGAQKIRYGLQCAVGGEMGQESDCTPAFERNEHGQIIVHEKTLELRAGVIAVKHQIA